MWKSLSDIGSSKGHSDVLWCPGIRHAAQNVLSDDFGSTFNLVVAATGLVSSSSLLLLVLLLLLELPPLSWPHFVLGGLRPLGVGNLNVLAPGVGELLW